ncbi:MAG: AAA family ATPase [Clostridiales bacterium]|nr:AAA family ATPase [Clostridiales bacterium]
MSNGFLEGLPELDEDDDLPDLTDEFINLEWAWNRTINLKPELIEGVLREGHKMMIAGPSKAGKSFALIELAICISTGIPWMGRFNCKKGNVLYVNLELDRASCLDRFYRIREAMGLNDNERFSPCTIWNLRGHVVPLNALAPAIIRRYKYAGYAAIIIDPIYKVLTGNENNAYDMAQFCNYFDRISTECNCAVIYCHHHSKGDQSWKRSADRASGSGVFARDVDALLDMTELELPKQRQRDGITAWRVTGTLREFQSFPPVDVWFDYPLHVLEHFAPEENVAPHHELPSYQRAMNARKSKEQKLMERKRRLEAAYDICAADGTVTVSTLAEYLGVSVQTIRNSVDEHPLFSRSGGEVHRV